MFLSAKQLIQTKQLTEWTFPQLHRGKHWYVDFYALDPARGRLRRKKYMLDHYKAKKARVAMATMLITNLVNLLKQGWNPWTTATRTREYTPWATIVKRYREYLKVAVEKDQLRPKTAYDYRSRVGALETFIEETGREMRFVYQFDRAFIVDYLDYLIFDKDVKSQTRNNYRTWLSTFGTWLTDRQYLTENPAEGIKSLREQEKTREPLSKAMLGQLRAYLYNNNKPFLLACMIEYYAAIRPEELRHIRLRDISVKGQYVTVRADFAKNHKTQAVALHDNIIRLMVELRTFDHPSHEYLFGPKLLPSEEQTYINHFRYEWKKVREALRWGAEYQFYSLKDAGIRDTINALGVLVARDQARHSDISITNIYAKRPKDPHDEAKHFEGEL
jgi:site-specific recombinase XerC